MIHVPRATQCFILGLLLAPFAGVVTPSLDETSTGRPALPDLDVLWISRDPKYPPGPFDFEGTENPTVKHFPQAGEAVVFTAHVANRGAVLSPPGSFAWNIDGEPAGSGTIPALAMDGEANFTLSWSWLPNRHTVEFVADSENAVPEISEHNNRRADPTDALQFQMRVTPEIHAAFLERANGVGTFSFEDWVQEHVRIMNELFAFAVWPSTPQGILQRVRIDEEHATGRPTSRP